MRPDAERPAGQADGRAPGRRRCRRWTRLARLAAAVLAVVLLALAAGGWFYAGEIRKSALDPAPPSGPEYRIPVLALEDGTVALARDASSPGDLTTEGTWGVQWPTGYGQLGAIRRLGPDRSCAPSPGFAAAPSRSATAWGSTASRSPPTRGPPSASPTRR
jgi:hypothetical protein